MGDMPRLYARRYRSANRPLWAIGARMRIVVVNSGTVSVDRLDVRARGVRLRGGSHNRLSSSRTRGSRTPRDSADAPGLRLHAGFFDRQPRVVAHWIPAFAGMTKLLLKLALMPRSRRTQAPLSIVDRRPRTRRNIGRSRSSANSGRIAICSSLGQNSSTRSIWKPEPMRRFNVVPRVR
jgi:hypothetical protein